MIPTATTHLHTVTRHWPDLQHALTQHSSDTWPPAGRMADYLATLDADAVEQLRAEAAVERLERNPNALGEHPVPPNLRVYETLRTVEAALVELADVIASAVQRSPMGPAPADWPATDRARRDQLAAADRTDPRRWTYTGPRSAPQAAEWLRARVQGQPGPFQPLTEQQHRHIAHVAAEAARRVTGALGMGRVTRPIARTCPWCVGQLTMHTGGTEHPSVTCSQCGRDWTGHELYELLRRLDGMPAAS